MNYLASFPSIKLIISLIFSKPAKSLRAFFFASLNFALLLVPSESCSSHQGVACPVPVCIHHYVYVHSSTYSSLSELRSVEEAIQRCMSQ